MTGMPGKGLMTRQSDFPSASSTGLIHASAFLPWIFIPSEPQTPSRQERR